MERPYPPARIEWLDRASALMDTQFRIPFTNIRFGWDFVIGLVPYAGDLLSFLISATLVIGMARHGASGRVLIQMLWNILLDTLVGSIPILGDIFDLAFKANRRNFRLFRDHHNEGKYQGSGCGIILALLVFIGLILFFAVWSIVLLSTWLWGLVF
jgi:hypothetical protein